MNEVQKMKRNNKYGKEQYFLYSIAVFFIACFWYRGSFLCEYDVLDMEDTAKYLFYPVFVGSFLLHITLTDSNQRNAASLLNVLIPCEIITVMCYFERIRYVVMASGALFILTSVLFTVMLLSRDIAARSRVRRKRIFRGRIKRSLAFSKYSFIFSFFIVLIMAFYFSYITPAIDAYKFEKYRSSAEAQRLTTEHQYEKLEPLQNEELWSELSTKERTEILETMLEIETVYIGLPDSLRLEIKKSEDKRTYGSYNDREKKIILYNIEEKTAETVLKTLLHEVFHSAEYRLVDVYKLNIPDNYKELYFFRNAPVYYEEFLDYQDAGNDTESYLLYASQKCERDADAYAEERAADILADIHRWVNGYGLSIDP